jgi:hypothetical protein
MSLPPAIRALSDQLREALLPGTRLYVVIIEHPDGCSYTTSAPDRDPHSALPADALPAVVAAADTMAPLASESPVLFLQRLRRNKGLISKKPKEWASLLGISAASLLRAMDEEALGWTHKPDGRDHGARLVRVDHLQAHLALLDAVERGVVAPPVWCAAVQGGHAERESTSLSLRDAPTALVSR